MTDSELEEILQRSAKVHFLHRPFYLQSPGSITLSFWNPDEFDCLSVAMFFQDNFQDTENSLIVEIISEDILNISFAANEYVLNVKSLSYNKQQYETFKKRQPNEPINLGISCHYGNESLLKISEIDPDFKSRQPIHITFWKLLP